MLPPDIAATLEPERTATVYGRKHHPNRWPYGSRRPFYYRSDEEWIEAMISAGFAVARSLYLRGVYSAEEMEEHIDRAVEAPLFAALCPHHILPDNCRHCCPGDADYWMGP